MAPRFNLNSRTIAMPLAAFCMASLLFVYARTSISSAKRNAQQHREADGGQLSWRNESLRRHGALAPPGEGGEGQQQLKRDEAEERVREAAARGRRRE